MELSWRRRARGVGGLVTRREIRGLLRAATAAGIVQGWYQPTPDTFLVSPAPAPTQSYSMSEASEYCDMLRASGLEPLFRDSEPLSL